MKISVCMAAYNGEAYIQDQVLSIVRQLDYDDEIVVVDDASNDGTIAILESFQDDRIRILRHDHNCGVVKTFEDALREAKGDVVILCDQDDLWREDKARSIRSEFRSHPYISLVISDGGVIDADGNITAESWLKSTTFKPGLVTNIVRNRYLGCAMAFRRSLLAFCLPFPEDTPMHDMWIGLVNQLFGKFGFISKPLFYYRRHGRNITTGKHASLRQMLTWRFALVKNLTKLYLRRRSLRGDMLIPHGG